LGLKDKYDLDDLNDYIKPERDLQFNYLGMKTLYDRYLLKDKKGNPIELPQHMFMAIAMFLAQNELNCQDWAKKFYDLILLSKFGGGIGWDWNLVRSMGGSIDGHKNAAGGIIPFLKITNDIAIAVDQLGTRKGAIAVYIEPWHMDISDFLDLKKNSGEERRRAHDLFPALWINDLFMKRAANDEIWTLFDPYEVSDLSSLYGEEFEKRYEEYENDPNIAKERIRAKELWKKILTELFETGNPFLCFKDNANKTNPNDHTGIIRSSNLCTEIFQNTEPNHYKIKIVYEDGTTDVLEESDLVKVDSGIEKEAKKVTALDTIGGKKIFIVEKEMIEGKTAVCNLASVNLSKINTKEDIERVVPIAIRMLDNVIDLNFYPHAKVKHTNLKSRAVGLGVMGEAQMLAERGIEWGSYEHLSKIDRGGLFGYTYNWEDLRAKVKEFGLRNGYLMAIAPTSSISILVGTTQAIEPVYKRKWFEENLSGMIPVVVPNLSPDTWAYYTPAYDLDQRVLIKAGAIRQKWIDQGQSLNIFMTLDKASGKYLNDIYMLGWKLGIKSTYYLRSQSPENKIDVADRSLECEGCQ